MIKKLRNDFFKEFQSETELVVYCIENDITIVSYQDVEYPVGEISDLWQLILEKKFLQRHVPKHLLSEVQPNDPSVG